jgi:MtaA/CmuA family methyltransferase
MNPTLETLTPLTRYRTVLSGQIPDRVPVTPFIMGLAARLAGVDYSDYCRSGEIMAQAQLACVRRFGYDSVNVTADAVREAETVGLPVVWPENDVPAGAGEPFIRDLTDLRKLRLPDPLGPNRMREQIRALQLLNRELEPEGQFVWGWVEAPFEEAAILRNLNAFMVDLHERPGLATEIVRFAFELETAFGLAQIEAGARFIGIGDPICTLAGPAHFERYNFPFLTQMIAAFKQRGVTLLYHVCGNTRRLLPCLARLDVDVVQLDSSVDLAEARQVLPEQMSIMGNLDTSQVMLFGTPETIREQGRRLMRIAGSNGGYILSAGCEVPPNTPLENLAALVQCAQEDGKYPLEEAASRGGGLTTQ